MADTVGDGGTSSFFLGVRDGFTADTGVLGATGLVGFARAGEAAGFARLRTGAGDADALPLEAAGDLARAGDAAAFGFAGLFARPAAALAAALVRAGDAALRADADPRAGDCCRPGESARAAFKLRPRTGIV